jgi:hypothetical protein
MKGATNLAELRTLLEPFMIRREMDDPAIGLQLPPLIPQRVPLEVSAQEMQALYEEEVRMGDREEFISSVREDFSALGDQARLLRLTGEAKAPAAVRFVKDLLATREKVAVFAWHREVIRKIEDGLRPFGVVVYHGGMSDAQKSEAKKTFMESAGCRVFIGQIQASATGLDGLQKACSCAVAAEVSWVPGQMTQLFRRIRRMGQKATTLLGYVLHIPGTLESAVLGVNDAKQCVIDCVFGSGWGSGPSRRAAGEDFQVVNGSDPLAGLL